MQSKENMTCTNVQEMCGYHSSCVGQDIVRLPHAAKVLNICYCCSSVVSVRISRAMQGGLIDLMGESIPLVDELHKGIPVVQYTRLAT